MFDELWPGEELGDDHVTARLEVDLGHCQRQLACGQTRLGRLIQPGAKQLPHDVDVEVQRQRMVGDEAAGEGRLAHRWRAVHQDQAGAHPAIAEPAAWM